jgi:hypothetical protein
MFLRKLLGTDHAQQTHVTCSVSHQSSGALAGLTETHHVTATQLVHWRADCCLPKSYNILSTVACRYRGVFIELLPGDALSKSVKI